MLRDWFSLELSKGGALLQATPRSGDPVRQVPLHYKAVTAGYSLGGNDDAMLCCCSVHDLNEGQVVNGHKVLS